MMDRTQIAALALSGILGSTDEDGRPLATPELAAREAVAYADALLAELRFAPQSRENGRSPVDDRGAVHGEAVSGTASDCRESPSEIASLRDAEDGENDGAPKPEPAPTSFEARRVADAL